MVYYKFTKEITSHLIKYVRMVDIRFNREFLMLNRRLI